MDASAAISTHDVICRQSLMNFAHTTGWLSRPIVRTSRYMCMRCGLKLCGEQNLHTVIGRNAAVCQSTDGLSDFNQEPFVFCSVCHVHCVLLVVFCCFITFEIAEVTITSILESHLSASYIFIAASRSRFE